MHRFRAVLGPLLIAAALTATLQARDAPHRNPMGASGGQTAKPSTGTGLLMGTVVDALNDRPVSGSLVMLGAGISITSTSLINPAFTQDSLGGGNVMVLTDELGRFVFTDLPKGTYSISASKAGYRNGVVGRRRAEGPAQVLVLGEGERLGDLKIPIWKNATITGAITDDAGDPVIGISVRVLLRTFIAGKRMLSPGAIVTTDDRGVYRVTSLVPGDYVIAVPSTQTTAPVPVVDLYQQAVASGKANEMNRDINANNVEVSALLNSGGLRVGGFAFQSTMGFSRTAVAPPPAADGRFSVYPTQYYPTAMIAAQATVITVGIGEQRSGVDMQLKLTPTSRVSGTITGPDGPVSAGLSLVPGTDDLSTDTDFETATAMSDATGAFTLLGVPSGQYLLRVTKIPPSNGPGAPTRPTLWAAMPISVESSDIPDVVVSLRTGFHISGRLAFDDDAKKPTADVLRRAAITIEAADGRTTVGAVTDRASVDAEGRFSTAELLPGRYFIRANTPFSGWTLKSAMFNGRDISNVPVPLDADVSGVVVTFTQHTSEINGSVLGSSGARDATSTVLVFPAESMDWSGYGVNPRRLRSVRVERDGTYRIVGLPSGDYMVIAVADESVRDWQDPANLQQLARVATRVTLGDGELHTQELKSVVVSK